MEFSYRISLEKQTTPLENVSQSKNLRTVSTTSSKGRESRNSKTRGEEELWGKTMFSQDGLVRKIYTVMGITITGGGYALIKHTGVNKLGIKRHPPWKRVEASTTTDAFSLI